MQLGGHYLPKEEKMASGAVDARGKRGPRSGECVGQSVPGGHRGTNYGHAKTSGNPGVQEPTKFQPTGEGKENKPPSG